METGGPAEMSFSPWQLRIWFQADQESDAPIPAGRRV